MASFASLQLLWSAGYQGTDLAFVSDGALVYGSGNTLSFIGRDGTHIRSIPSHGEGVGCIGVCTNSGLLAYSELGMNPRIFVLSYPQLEIVTTLEGGAKLGYSHLGFSRSGNYLLSISEVPDFKLTLWKTTEGKRVCDTRVGAGVEAVSFNPLNWKQICVISKNSMRLWTLEQTTHSNLFKDIEVQLPLQTAPVGKVMEPTTSMVQPLPHDKRGLHLENIIYQASYTDASRRPSPVVPKSHCWTPNGSIYCGCQDGQLFLVDSESGSATVLLSPLSANDRTGILLSEAEGLLGGDHNLMRLGGVGVDANVMGIVEEEPSQVDIGPNNRPAHEVLRAGDVDCIALNRKGLYVAGKNGVIYCLELSKDLTVLDHWEVGEGVAKLAWSASYDKLVLATEQSVIHLVEPFNLCNLELVVNYASDRFIGVEVLPVNSNFSVTCRRNGIVQVWSTRDAGLVSTLDLQTTCSCIHSLSSCSCVVIGSESGHLYFISMLQPRKPNLVSRQLLYHSPLSLIGHDQGGHFVVAASRHSSDVYILDGRPSGSFQVVGHTSIGEGWLVSNISVAGTGDGRGTVVLLISTVNHEETKTLAYLCCLPVDLLERNVKDTAAYSDETLALHDTFIKKCTFSLPHYVEHLSVLPGKMAIGVLPQSRELLTVNLPQSDSEYTSTDFEKVVKVHEMKVNSLAVSHNGRLILLGGANGILQLRPLSNLTDVSEAVVHDGHFGGCIKATFTNDSCCVLSVGDNGLLLCMRVEYRQAMLRNAALQYAEDRYSKNRPLYVEQNSILKKMSTLGHVEGYTDSHDEEDLEMVRGMGDGSCDEGTDQTGQPKKQDSVVPSRATSARVSFRTAGSEDDDMLDKEKTWLETAQEQTTLTDDDQYSEMKAELRHELQLLRSKVLGMIKANEELPDMEKLERHEFILDTEEHQRLLREEEAVIAQVREDLELSNLANLYLREIIKQQCWDDMMVKGKVLKAFQSSLEVSNYALRQKPPEEMKKLERVKAMRRLEMAESKARSKFASSGEQQVEEGFEEEEDIMVAVKGEEGDKDPFALVGSKAAVCGGDCDLLYNQFELYSVERMKHQILFHQDCVYCVKQAFNKEFEEVRKVKVGELQRIQERNVRISKIIQDLSLSDEVHRPALDYYEDPEVLMKVDDSEVTVERYLSPEEKKRMEEAAQLEEERRMAEMADNWRKRALDMMMDGRLEANLEEDLFKDLVRPEFMSKPPEAMTEEEMKLAREFEKKEEELLEEREKYKKGLESELRRLQEATLQGMEGFDEKLKRLFYLKIKSEIAVNQEELKILRLGAAILLEEEMLFKESQLNKRLEDKKNAKITLASFLTSAKHEVDRAQQAYDMALAEDKDLDKGFRKEFSDCELYMDQLYKLYKKRPRGQRLKGVEGGLQHDPSSTNPFAHRPVSALGGKKTGGDALVELDHPSNIPEGIDRPVWDRLVHARRRKFESELRVKHFALELADAQAFLDGRLKEDEAIQRDIQDTFRELNILRDGRAQNALNLEIQLLLKQGQVEVETGQFIPNYSDCILMNRKIVEDLNAEIKELGKAKISIMRECKDFKKGIHLLEWEHKKIKMQAEDLLTKAKDIQNLKVTKELQKRLMEEGKQERTFQQENELLEQTLALNEKMLQKATKEKQRTLTKLRQQITDKKRENVDLDQKLRELQVCVLERKEIEDLAGTPPAEANAEAKMQDIVLRRRLVETAKSQAQEISLLRAELERLRMRTFPALVQADS